jgi:hypothetical protein
VGNDPPFHVPVFAHEARATVTKDGGTTFAFVTDGIEPALDQARAAAGDKDVSVAAAPMSFGSTYAPGCSTSSRSTSCPSCSALAFACSMAGRAVIS